LQPASQFRRKDYSGAMSMKYFQTARRSSAVALILLLLRDERCRFAVIAAIRRKSFNAIANACCEQRQNRFYH
jgi:hypothetical protein